MPSVYSRHPRESGDPGVPLVPPHKVSDYLPSNIAGLCADRPGREPFRTRPSGIEKRLCRFQINCVEAFGKAIVDGLKNLGSTGSIVLLDPQPCSAKSGT